MADINYEKARIPGEESGIEVKYSVCDICTPGSHCGLTCYVKDGKVIKVYDDASRQATFTYNGNLLVGICDLNRVVISSR